MPGAARQQQTLADMSGQAAYIKPVHTLVASTTRVSAQITGRVIFVHTEVLKSGCEKAIAVMVDKDKKHALKSVLVHEAWAPADQARMRKILKPLEGKVVSITNAKIVPRNKSCVFCDTSIKAAFDLHTVVAECSEDDSYPTRLPVLPNLKAAEGLGLGGCKLTWWHASMVSLVAAVTQEGQAAECNVRSGTKLVAHLKMATGSTNMTAAFWDHLAEKMGSAKMGQVYRLDWVCLKQESPGKYQLTSVAASSVHLEEGEAATAVQDSLADPAEMISMTYGKAAYIKPVHTLVASSSRLAESIKGRLLFVRTEVLKAVLPKIGREKEIAVMVDKDKKCALKSVLVHEAWAPTDQARMRKILKPLEGKVVSITNAKIVPRGKSIVFFDSTVKSAFDQHTVVTVCPEDESYPNQLPVLPNLKATDGLGGCELTWWHASMVSLVAAVAEEGRAVVRNVSPSGKKLVTHLKMATGNTIMTAAFWDDLAEKMSLAKVRQVYRLDWVCLTQESPGEYRLTSVAGSSVDIEEGEAATAIQDSLADPAEMASMSSSLQTCCGQTYAEKMTKPFAQADLFALEEIQSLHLRTESVLLVPACYLLEARGVATDSPSRAWYTGCIRCQKQLELVGMELHCPQHGVNNGKRIYAGQVMLADPSHKKTFTVWDDDLLRRMSKEFLGHEDLDSENVLEDLCQALKGIELVVRVGVAMKNDSTSASVDLFDVAEQLNSNGCLAVYKAIARHFVQGLPGTAPACCRHVTVNDLGQLTVKAGDTERLVETAKLMVRVVQPSDLKVLDCIDGLEVCLKCECVCCKNQCLLYAAGLPQTVRVYTQIAAGEHLMAFVHTAEPDCKFPLGYHVLLRSQTDVATHVRVFKSQVAQVISGMSSSRMPTETDERELKMKRTKAMETLLTCARSESKRLRRALPSEMRI